MIVLIAFALSVVGLVLLLYGALPMSRIRWITGFRARVVGFVLLLTWPSLLLTGAIAAAYWMVNASASRGEPITQNELVTLLTPYADVYRALSISIVLLIAVVAAYWRPRSQPRPLVGAALPTIDKHGAKSEIRDVGIQEATYRLGISEAALRRLVDAGELLTVRSGNITVIEGASLNSLLRVKRAVDLVKYDELEAAIGELDQAIALNPSLLRAYLLRCRVYFSAGELAPARKDAEHVLQLQPGHAEATTLIAQLNDGVVISAAEKRRARRQSTPVGPTRFDEDLNNIPVFLASVAVLLIVMIVVFLQSMTSVNKPCTGGNFDCARLHDSLTQIAQEPTQHADERATATRDAFYAPRWTAQHEETSTSYAVLAPTWSVQATGTILGITAYAPTMRALEANQTASVVANAETFVAEATAVAGSQTATAGFGQTQTARRFAQATGVALSPRKQLPGKLILVHQDSGQVGTFDLRESSLHVFSIGKLRTTNAKWSPDGSLLALDAWLPSGYTVYVTNADGSNPRAITDPKDQSTHSAWSPDGKLLAVVNHPTALWQDMYPKPAQTTSSELMLYSVAGSTRKRVISSNDLIENPSLSADGKAIVFCLRTVVETLIVSLPGDLYMVNVDGSNLHRLTSNNHSCAPSWSPDGQHIAYTIGTSTGHPDVYLMNADGTGAHPIAECIGGHPNWSPDSKYIVFTGGFSQYCNDTNPGDQEIFMYDVDTQALSKITPDGFQKLVRNEVIVITSPSWGP